MLPQKLPVTLFPLSPHLFSKFNSTLKKLERTFGGQFWYDFFLVLGCHTCIPFNFITSCVRIVSKVCVNYKFKIIYTNRYVKCHRLTGKHSFFSFLRCLSSWWCFSCPLPPEFSLWKGEGPPYPPLTSPTHRHRVCSQLVNTVDLGLCNVNQLGELCNI